MKVRIIAHTPHPDMISAAAAKLTHSKSAPDELLKDEPEKMNKLLKSVVGMGHTSVIEHAYFTFSIEGISRACSHQLVRHRMASYSQQSQRYVSMDEPQYVIPPKIKANAKLKKAYDEAMHNIWGAYNALMKIGIPAEDARYILPNAAKTNIIMSMDGRALMNFFELRCCLHAQWEIRELAWRMHEAVKKVAPTIFENAGPVCKTRGECPEKAKDCPNYPKTKNPVHTI
jgi:thymidylate synthase (FAD)